MPFDAYSRASLWSNHMLSSVTQWAQRLLGHSDFTPEQALTEAKNIDPRLVPKVPMQSADIDTNLLLELSKLGMKHGKLVTEQSHPELMQSWKSMSTRAGLKKTPQLIIVESKTVNAMTVSPEEVVMTTGLLKKLDLREVSAVLGHELAHAASDHKRPRIAATAIFGGAGVITGHKLWDKMNARAWNRNSRLLGTLDEVLFAMAGGTLGGVVANQVSVKPTEFQADLRGAAICGDPLGLVSALRKLEAGRTHNPLTSMLAYLHSGYPTTGQRIRNLETIADQMPALPAVPPVISRAAPVAVLQPSPQVTSIAADARIDAAASPQLS